MPSKVPEIALASASPYRKAQLAKLIPVFRTAPANIDESPVGGESAADLALRLASSKARHIAREFPEALVIGSDQVAVFNQKIIGKPGSPARAKAQLRAASGHSVDFLTALTLVDSRIDRSWSHLDTTRVEFIELNDNLIDAYLHRDQPWDCAGSFKVESLGPALFRAVHSEDPSALIGLPLIALCRLLRQAGLEPLQLQAAGD